MRTKKKYNPKENNISITPHDLYQFLIAEHRYGYTRNNHLMPDGAYDHAKEYLLKMLAIDEDWAIHTASQLCEECIGEQLLRFYDGLDDEFDNRKKAVEYIEYLLNWIHTNSKPGSRDSLFIPYNYDQYVNNVERHNNLTYRVYELDNFDVQANVIKELTTVPVTKRVAYKILFDDELGTSTGAFNHFNIKTSEYPVRVIGEIIRVIDPESHRGKVYSIKLSD